MGDVEDDLRRTFAAHEGDAPSGDGFLAKVHAASHRRARGRWLVPLAASALTASLVVALVTDGFGLVGGESATQPGPVTTTSTPTPNPSQSAIAAKCAMPPFIGAPGQRMVDFDPDVDQEITVGAGQQILLGGIDNALCQRFVTFNGRPRSDLLKPVNGIGTGSDRLRAVGQGTVVVAALQPMCAAVADPECFGGIDQLGSIAVTIKPRPTPEPVTRPCDSDQVTLAASSEPGTAGRMLAATLVLANGPSCLLSTQVRVDVTRGDGIVVRMPDNPSWQLISEPIHPRTWLVVRWRWREPFCGDDFPYSVTLSLPLLGLSDTLDDVNVPRCPTAYGDPATDPRGLEVATTLTASARR